MKNASDGDIFIRVAGFFIFAEDCWPTASDFQQHFERIACFINSKSIQSQLIVCIEAVFALNLFIIYHQKIIKSKGNILRMSSTFQIKGI